MNRKAVAALTDIIRALHEGSADRTELSRRFKAIAADVSSAELAAAEQAAIDEGVPQESVRRLCDVHLDMFTDDARSARTTLPAGHPVSIMYAEHDTLLDAIRKARHAFDARASKGSGGSPADLARAVSGLLPVLEGAERNFSKQENAFFPVVERHGITRPPAIMWSEHDMMRELFKKFAALGPSDVDEAGRILLEAEEILSAHVQKEERVLFQAALSMFSDEEWAAIRRDFDELGYLHETVPAYDVQSTADSDTGGGVAADSPGARQPDTVRFPSGTLSAQQLLAVFSTLPVDITVVDTDDKVAFFSETPERIFPRARSVVGRAVQNCHPPKSVHVVQEILDSFRAGTRDMEEFSLHLGEKYVHIRYYALRSDAGDYLGCLEVSQDIAPIQAISGEKRIL